MPWQDYAIRLSEVQTTLTNAGSWTCRFLKRGLHAHLQGCTKWIGHALNRQHKIGLFCKSYSHFFSKNTCELDIVLTGSVNILTTNELVKLMMLWTIGPRIANNVDPDETAHLWCISFGSAFFVYISVLVYWAERIKQKMMTSRSIASTCIHPNETDIDKQVSHSSWQLWRLSYLFLCSSFFCFSFFFFLFCYKFFSISFYFLKHKTRDEKRKILVKKKNNWNSLPGDVSCIPV